MDNSSLNASHRYARQANKFFRSAKFDEAISCHDLARKKIDEAIQSVSSNHPGVLESLRLQKQFHTKQIELVVVRREQHEKCMTAQLAVDKGQKFQSDLEESREVQLELFKSLDNAAERVVEMLEQKTVSGSNNQASEFHSKLLDLKLLNQQSLILVNRLVTQLNDRITENEDLREMLDDKSSRVSQARTSSLEKKSREMSEEELDKVELPPLELPTFDFHTFSSLSAEDTGDSAPQSGTKDQETLRRIGLGSLEDEVEEEE